MDILPYAEAADINEVPFSLPCAISGHRLEGETLTLTVSSVANARFKAYLFDGHVDMEGPGGFHMEYPVWRIYLSASGNEVGPSSERDHQVQLYWPNDLTEDEKPCEVRFGVRDGQAIKVLHTWILRNFDQHMAYLAEKHPVYIPKKGSEEQ